MGLIEVVMTVCSLAHSGDCSETHLQFVDQGASLMQCTMEAPVYIAAWADDHPGEKITRWHCAYPKREEPA